MKPRANVVPPPASRLADGDEEERRQPYSTILVADFSRASPSITPCFFAAAGLT